MSCVFGVEQSCEECRICGNKKKQTNSDHIRNMTNRELAEIIMCPYGIDGELCGVEKGCMICCMEWLESEVSE